MKFWKRINGHKTVIGTALLSIILILKSKHPDWPIWEQDWFAIVEYILGLLAGGGLIHKGYKLIKGETK